MIDFIMFFRIEISIYLFERAARMSRLLFSISLFVPFCYPPILYFVTAMQNSLISLAHTATAAGRSKRDHVYRINRPAVYLCDISYVLHHSLPSKKLICRVGI